MVQYGFFFDQSRCIGCHTCEVACKNWHDLPPGPLKYMRVYKWEKSVFPNVRVNTLAIPCYHCEKPVCADACPGRAIIKENKYGAVLIDEEACNPTIFGCNRACWEACPYGSIVFASDDLMEKAQKCTMCIDRLEQGKKPICVLSCSMRALEFGPIDELKEKFSKKFTLTQQLEEMPSPEDTKPAIWMKTQNPKKQLIPYNPDKALNLWQQRGPYAHLGLPPVFNSKEDVINVTATKIGHDKLMLKAKSSVELMYYTMDEE